MGYFTSPKIAFGPSAIEQLASLGARRALVLVDPALARATRPVRAEEELRKAGAAVERVDAGTADATTASVDALLAGATSFAPDWIVAIGGGRTIDTAKGLWVRYRRPELPLSAVSPLAELDLRARARFAALPTTCGSGSEATWVAYLRGDDGVGLEVASRELAPDWAIVDPTFLETLSTPRAAEAAAGAIGHAFDAFVSAWSNPFSDALALQAISTALPALGRLVRHRDAEVDAALHLSATQAGLAAANAQLGLTHALATTLANEF
ncbi:MAG TPA: iron-containing alcohol dehydrogenase, partial [Thermoplasmata archaeon]